MHGEGTYIIGANMQSYSISKNINFVKKTLNTYNSLNQNIIQTNYKHTHDSLLQ